ncbi:glycosyltransferase [Microbacter sp. GSS18]|nr:glycosyltransferase [Microbacter sp. GSS18]
MTDLVVVSLERWDDVWRRNQHLLWRLLHTDPALRVLFVEPPADPTHDVRSKRRPQLGHRPSDELLAGRLWRMRPVKPLPRRLDPRADDRLALQIERAAQRLGFDAPLLWVNDPGGAVLSRRTGWPTLYDMTDDWLAAERPGAELERIAAHERYLFAHAAEVVACSPELQRRKAPERPASMPAITVVRNAVDVAAYRRPRPRPADLPTGAVVLYVGTLHGDRLDVDLCAELAATLTGAAAVVFVGPDALTPAQSSRLRASGARLLGPRGHDEVVAYLQHADVLIVPHVVTSFTESLDPIKLYEYLAVDRPVVSTAVAGFRDAADPRVAIAAREDVIRVVQEALTTAAPPEWSAADVADWDERASAMRAVLDRMPAPA